MTDKLEHPIAGMLKAYKADVFAKDVDAVAALYDQDVCLFDLWGQWSYNDVAEWRGMLSNWFGSLRNEMVIVDVDNVPTIVAPDVVVAHALLIYRSVSANGDKLNSMFNRLTWVLKRKGGEWKIVHEHTSAPVDSTTLKVILQR